MPRFDIDQAGLDFITAEEGYRDIVYPDSRGFATIGIGHLIHKGPPTRADHATYDHKGKAFYERLLHDDVRADCLQPMNDFIRVPLNQHRVNALCSGAINCGPGFIYGTVGKRINAGDFAGAAKAFLLWSHPDELAPRRHREIELFDTPVQAAAPRFPWLDDDERGWVLEYDRLVAAQRDAGRRAVLRRYMRHQAVRITVAAHNGGAHGWDKHDRRRRYHSLVARAGKS